MKSIPVPLLLTSLLLRCCPPPAHASVLAPRDNIINSQNDNIINNNQNDSNNNNDNNNNNINYRDGPDNNDNPNSQQPPSCALDGSSTNNDYPSSPQQAPSCALNVLAAIQAHIDALGTAFESWPGTTADVTPLLEASNALTTALAHGTRAVDAAPPLSLHQTVKLTRPVRQLEEHARALARTISAGKTKGAIRDDGLCGAVAQQVGAMDEGSRALLGATVNKVPDVARGVAEKVAQGVLYVLADAKREFPGENC